MIITGELPERVKTLIFSCPQTGSGTRAVHRWILASLNELRHFVTSQLAADLILRHLSRRPKPGELEESVRTAYAHCGLTNAPAAHWPRANPALIDCVAAEMDRGRSGLEMLRAGSKPIPATAAGIMEKLFGSKLVCVGLHERTATIAPVAKLEPLERFPLIVPNPMSARFVIDPVSGRKLERSIANTAPERRFIVTDFDLKAPVFGPVLDHWAKCKYTPQDGQALLIRFLEAEPSNGKLALVVFSGSHSLQAWWSVAGIPTEKLAVWFHDTVLIGADPAGWTPCQYFRMPRAKRPNIGTVQEPIYFDPSCLEPQSELL